MGALDYRKGAGSVNAAKGGVKTRESLGICRPGATLIPEIDREVQVEYGALTGLQA